MVMDVFAGLRTADSIGYARVPLRPRDTDPEVQRMLEEHNRRLAPSDKGRQLLAAWSIARKIQLAGLRHDRPEASEEELLEEFYRRRLGDELYREACAARERSRG